MEPLRHGQFDIRIYQFVKKPRKLISGRCPPDRGLLHTRQETRRLRYSGRRNAPLTALKQRRVRRSALKRTRPLKHGRGILFRCRQADAVVNPLCGFTSPWIQAVLFQFHTVRQIRSNCRFAAIAWGVLLCKTPCLYPLSFPRRGPVARSLNRCPPRLHGRWENAR
jgi:hypothetical protein